MCEIHTPTVQWTPSPSFQSQHLAPTLAPSATEDEAWQEEDLHKAGTWHAISCSGNAGG